MRNKKIIATITLGLIGSVLLTACNVSGGNTVQTTDLTILSAASTAPDTLATTETAAQTETTKAATPTPTEKPTVTPTVTPTTVTETSATTVATTTAKPTKAPTQPTQTIAPAATTAAPPPTTAAPTEPPATTTQSTTPAYTENPDVIRDGIIQYAKDNGVWYPDGEVVGYDEKSFSLGYLISDQQYIDSYKRKILPNGEKWYGIVTVNCWIENGWIYISSEVCSLPDS